MSVTPHKWITKVVLNTRMETCADCGRVKGMGYDYDNCHGPKKVKTPPPPRARRK